MLQTNTKYAGSWQDTRAITIKKLKQHINLIIIVLINHNPPLLPHDFPGFCKTIRLTKLTNYWTKSHVLSFFNQCDFSESRTHVPLVKAVKVRSNLLNQVHPHI